VRGLECAEYIFIREDSVVTGVERLEEGQELIGGVIEAQLLVLLAERLHRTEHLGTDIL
jgi:hypothetical protein